MPRSEYDPVPDVEAREAAPDDLQHINVPENAFGAGLGRAAENAGEGLARGVEFYSQVAADHATNNYLEQSSQILYGDLSRPAVDENGNPILGPDGSPVGQGGFYSLRGADALSAAPGVRQQLDDLIAHQESTLQTQGAREQFDTVSRRYQNQETTRMGAFYDEQNRVWAKATNDKGIALTQNSIVMDLNNPDRLAADLEALKGFYIKNNMLTLGHTDTAAQAGLLQAQQDFALTQIRARLGMNDGAGAQKVFDDNLNYLGSLPNFDAIQHAVKESVINGEFSPAVDQFTNTALSAARSLNTPGALSPTGGVVYTAPVPGAPRESSGFGVRTPPTAGASSYHQGVDFAVPDGTPVHPVAPGMVSFVGQRGGYGETVEVRHPDGSLSLYGHLSKIDVQFGQQVTADQTIALSGHTGIATGPHLHLGIQNAQGQWINPNTVLGRPAGIAASSAAPPTGGVYDQISAAAAEAGATPDEQAYLRRVAYAESRGNVNAQNGSATGLFQFHPDTFAQYGGHDIRDVGQQTTAALAMTRANANTLRQHGLPATDANLYLLAEQGPVAGPALISAAPAANAAATIAPAYHGDLRKAQEAIRENVPGVWRGRAETMTAGQFVGLTQRGFSGRNVPADTNAGATSSVADNLRTMMPTILDQARTFAEQKWPNYPDVQERFEQTVERRLQQTIGQQDQQYLVDTHIVQSALLGPNAPTSESELTARGPDVAAAWTRMQTENPLAAAGVERMFDANAHREAAVYGTEVKNYLDRVLAPDSDPSRITNPSQLWSVVGTGDGAPLTNTGAGALAQLTALRGTPDGEAFAAQARGFVDAIHARLTYSNAAIGIPDPEGEERFARFMAQALPILLRAYKDGTLPKLLNPQSPDYLGNMVNAYMRPPAKMMQDRLNARAALAVTPPGPTYTEQTMNQALNALDNDEQRQDALKDAVARGRIDLQTARAIAQQRGYIQGAPGSGGLPAAPVMLAPPAAEALPGGNVRMPDGRVLAPDGSVVSGP